MTDDFSDKDEPWPPVLPSKLDLFPRRIWSVPLDCLEFQQITLPTGSIALCVREKQYSPRLFVLGNSAAPPRSYDIWVIDTCSDVPNSIGTYLSSVQLGADMIFHVFVDRDLLPGGHGP